MPARRSLLATVRTGNHRASLEGMRDVLAALLDKAEPGVAAGIANRLQAVLADLAELPLPTGGSTVETLAARAAARRATSTGRKPPAAR